MRKKLYLLLATMAMLFGLMTVTASAESYYWPVPDNTKVTQRWGGGHYGIDIGWNLAKQPIHATKSGTIVAVYSVNGTNWGYGNGLIIRHTDGSGYSMYAHMDSVSVSMDHPEVTRGQFLGYMGNTGNSNGKHLHFELCSDVKMQGSYFNGQPYSINSNPDAIQYSYTLCEHEPVFVNDNSVVCSICNENIALPTLTVAPAYKQITTDKSNGAPAHVTPYGDATITNRYENGETVCVQGYVENAFGNTWYKLSTGEWIVDGYLDEHWHCYNAKGFCDLCLDGLSVVRMNNTTISLSGGKSSVPVHFAPYGASEKWTKQGSSVTVNGKVVNSHGNVWYRTTDGSWVFSDYLNTPVSSGMIRSSSGSLALNDAPAISPSASKMLAEMPTNSPVTVYTGETSGKWYSVYYNGQVGYAYGSYITVLDGSKAVEPPAFEEPGVAIDPDPTPAPEPTPTPVPETISVSLVAPTDPEYTKKFSVSETNATVVTNIRKSAGSKVTACGMWLYDANGNLIKEHRESVSNVGSNTTSFHSWYDINEEVGVTLESGTTYQYRFFTVVNGTTYQGELYSFTTIEPVTVPEPEPEPAVYRLTFDPNGGTSSVPYKDITFDTVIGTMPEPVRTGYTFDGWYSSAEGGNPIRETMRYNADFDVTIYAHWKPNTYRLTLDPNGGISTVPYKDITFDTVIGTMPAPVRSGYTFDGWYSSAEGGNPIRESMRYNADFDVTIYAHWTLIQTDTPVVVNPFTDVPKGSYYHDAVVWAKQNNVTGGTSATTFSPNLICTRSQVVTFLWSSQGKPEPASKVNPFTDVKESDWFYKPVLWAVEQGITSGTSATTFSPNATCTSGQVLTFLWASNGRPAAVTSDTAWYATAVAWADNAGLMENMGTFSAANPSPRAEIVTYLYRNAGSPRITTAN